LGGVLVGLPADGSTWVAFPPKRWLPDPGLTEHGGGTALESHQLPMWALRPTPTPSSSRCLRSA